MKTPNIMLIGCGPHAKRVYVPKLKEIESEYGIKLKAIVELKEKKRIFYHLLQNILKMLIVFLLTSLKKNLNKVCQMN